MSRATSRSVRALRLFPRSASLSLCAALAWGAAASAGTHTWDVNEVYSNADGSIQFVELRETGGLPNETGVGNQTLSSTGESFNMGAGSVSAPTTNKHYLIATPAFAALPGAPTPNVIIPAGNIPFFNTGGDTVTYGVYDSWNFGAVPTNGIDSLSRTTGVGANSPTNYAGQTGSVNGSPAVPASSPIGWSAAVLLVLASWTALVLRRRSARVRA